MTGERDRSAEHAWNGGTAIKTPGARAMRLPLRDLTPTEQLRTAGVLAAGAVDADELREFLAAAGLTHDTLRAARADSTTIARSC